MILNEALVKKVNSIIDSCFREVHIKYYRTFEFTCVYDVEVTNIKNNDIISLTTPDKSTTMCELNRTKKWFKIESNN